MNAAICLEHMGDVVAAREPHKHIIAAFADEAVTVSRSQAAYVLHSRQLARQSLDQGRY